MAGWQFRVASNAAASSWNDHTGDIERTTARFTAQAFDGQIGQGGVDLDDPDGDLVLPGYRVWEMNKDGLVLARGRIGVKDYERGVNRTGDSNERDITLIDCNADLSRIGVHRWSRPAETGYTRVRALRRDFLDGSPRASTVIGDAWIRNANTRTMPAKRYDNANPHEVLTDCAEVEAKIFFVVVNDDGTMDLFYDISTYTGYAAGVSITDDDPDLVTEFPPINPTANRDPEALFTKVRLTYGTGASVTATNAGQAAAHDYLETIYFDDNATASTAQAKADRFLDIHDQYEITRRCSVAVPEASLEQIRHGMTISYRAAATNDLTPVTRRIAQLTWQPPIADGQDWTAILELDLPLKVGQRYTKPKPPPDRATIPPWTGGCAPIPRGTTVGYMGLADYSGFPRWVNGYYAPWRVTPSPDNTQAVVAASGGTATLTVAAYDATHVTRPTASVILDIPGRPVELYYETKVETPFPAQNPQGGVGSMVTIMDADHATSGDEVNISVEWVPATANLTLHVDDTLPLNIPYTDDLTAINPVSTHGAWIAVRVRWEAGVMKVNAWPVGFDEPAAWMHDIYDGRNSFGVGTYLELGAYGGNRIGDYFGMYAQFQNLSFSEVDAVTGIPLGCPVPITGQWFPWLLVAIGDGVSDSWVLPGPYLPGTVEVLVDGIWQDAIETDPTTGEFQVDFVPEVGERVSVRAKSA